MTADEGSMPGPDAIESGSETRGRVFRGLLFTVFILLTTPVWLSPMGVGLDPSWMLGLHLAAARGLVHGRDFVFTYGPLGFALVPRDYGEIGLHAVALRLGLHLLWWASVGMLLFRVRGRLAPVVFVATMAMSGVFLDHELNFSLNGVVILSVLNFLLLAEIDRRPAWAVPAAFLAGASVLTKFNLGAACTASLGIWSLWQLAREPNLRQLGRLTLLAAVYFGTLVGFFLAYGGPVTALLPFLQGSRELASGYATQMTADEPGNPGFWVSMTLLGMTALGLAISLARRSTLALSFGLIVFPMFVMYKGVIVRQSIVHFYYSWPTMVSLTALLLPVASRSKQSGRIAAVGVFLVLAAGFWFAPTSVDMVGRRPSNWLTLLRLDDHRSALRTVDGMLKREQRLPDKFLARIGDAPVDVYPWETSYIWSNDLNWSPRPVFQSYAAYTPALDRMGADHYGGAKAPRFIIYAHYAIDFEHPCLVDSRTWIELLRWYDLVDGYDNLLLLQRRERPRWEGAKSLEEATTRFDRTVALPQASGFVFMTADLEMSMQGRIKAMLYKVDPPWVRVTYQDGRTAEHRLVWRNAAGGFLASDLPRDLGSVIRLFQQGEGDRVASLEFVDRTGLYKPDIRVSLLKSGLDPKPPSVASEDAPVTSR